MKSRRRLLIVACCILAAGWTYFLTTNYQSPKDAEPSRVFVRPEIPVQLAARPLIDSQSEKSPKLPAEIKKYTRKQKKLLAKAGLPEDTDLISEFLSGKRDFAKFSRTKEFYISVGFPEAEAEWKAAISCLGIWGYDPDSEDWKNKVREANKITDPALAKKYDQLSDSEVAGLASVTSHDQSLRAFLRPEQAGGSFAEQLAALLPNETYMEAPKYVAKLLESSPNSAWAPVLAAKAALERKDWKQAQELTQNFLNKKMEPVNLGLRDQMTLFLMEQRGATYEQASRYMVDGLDNDYLPRHTLDLARTYYEQARQLKAAGDPAWEALAANGLAMAEAGSEYIVEDGLHSQDDLLNLL